MSEQDLGRPVRVLVVDDEPLARAGIGEILREDSDIAIVGETATGQDALRAIRDLVPDVVFLDIGLPDMDGFEVVERMDPRLRPAVVFLTAHSDRALRAFEVEALDYVTKPLRRVRIRTAIARARARVKGNQIPRADNTSTASPSSPLALKVDGRVCLIEQRTIGWVTADDDHVVVHAGSVVFRTREALGQIEQRLARNQFVRIHRSTIVRVAEIRELQPWFHGDYVVLLQSGATLRLSRHYRKAVTGLLGLTASERR
jgi:two-component system LytT family response regulator